VLDALKRADHAVELHALLGECHCLVEHRLRGPERIGRQHHAPGIEHTRARRAGVIGSTQNDCRRTLERDVEKRPGPVEARDEGCSHALCIRGNERGSAVAR